MKSMTPEEEERNKRIDRLLEFLAANQAQLSASAHSHDAWIAENAKQIAQNSRDIAQVADLLLRLGRIVDEHERRTNEGFALLTNSLAALAGSQHRTDELLKGLSESQRRTDERFSALMQAIERYYSNGHH